jgi:hypothetical protein
MALVGLVLAVLPEQALARHSRADRRRASIRADEVCLARLAALILED